MLIKGLCFVSVLSLFSGVLVGYAQEGNEILSVVSSDSAPSSGSAVALQFEKIQVLSDRVSLQWTQLENATAYRVFREELSSGKRMEVPPSDYVIYYDSKPCAWSAPSIHYGTSQGWTSVPGKAMELVTDGEYAGWFKYAVLDAENLSITFNNGSPKDGSDWDSNNGTNYLLKHSGVYQLECKSSSGIQKVAELDKKGIGKTFYIDNAVKDGEKYSYRVVPVIAQQDRNDLAVASEVQVPRREITEYPWLTWNQASPEDRSVIVNYQTDYEEEGRVEVREKGSLSPFREVVGASARLHHIALDSLTPDTVYEYRMRYANGGVSPVYWFRHLPLNPSSVRFAVASDMQDGMDYNEPPRVWEEMARELRKDFDANKIDLLVIPGDFLSNDRFVNWKVFLDKGRHILPYVVTMPAVGNHDSAGDDNFDMNSSNPYGVARFKEYFSLPGKETHYSFHYGNVSFFVLNTEVVAIGSVEKDEQYVWLKDEIRDFRHRARNRTPWAFAFHHIPVISAHERHGEQTGLVLPVTKLLERHVDWSISGHVHAFQRFAPLKFVDKKPQKADCYGTRAHCGVGYLVLPPAGNYPSEWSLLRSDGKERRYENPALVPFLAEPQTRKGSSEVGYALFAIAGERFSLEVYGFGTLTSPTSKRLVDKLAYTKH